jgi:hypothetical protein
MSSLLRAQLDPDQLAFLNVVFEPFDNASEWPVWAYVDHVMDAKGLVAADVLASLPVAGGQGGGRLRYGLTWHQDGGTWLPSAGTRLALTVAGLWHLGTASAQILAAFKDAVRFLVERQRSIVPSPSAVVEARAASDELAAWLKGPGPGNKLGDAAEAVLRKTGQLLEHEPYLWHGFHRSAAGSDEWDLKIPASIRDYRDVTSAEDYIDKVERLVAPPEPPSHPLSAAPLDIPYAISFADAVWQSRTGSPLFSRPDPASIARLTQPCDSEGTFNSLMSALADVLSQVARPGTRTALRSGALEEVRDYLNRELDPPAAARCADAIGTLIRVRTIRHSIEHGDARAKAIAAYASLGIAFPVANWHDAWARISAITCGALDALREEAHAGLPIP